LHHRVIVYVSLSLIPIHILVDVIDHFLSSNLPFGNTGSDIESFFFIKYRFGTFADMYYAYLTTINLFKFNRNTGSEKWGMQKKKKLKGIHK